MKQLAKLANIQNRSIQIIYSITKREKDIIFVTSKSFHLNYEEKISRTPSSTPLIKKFPKLHTSMMNLRVS